MTGQIPRLSKIRIEALWLVGIGIAYLMLSPVIMRWTGRWPAPYWYSAGLSVLLAYGLLNRTRSVLLLTSVFSCVVVFAAWLFSLGIYQAWFREWFPYDVRRYFSDYWIERLPVWLLLTVFVALLMLFRKTIAVRHILLGALIFAVALFLLSRVAEAVCMMGLYGNLNYDTFGFRLGGYFLLSHAICLLIVRVVLYKIPVATANADV